MSRDMYSGERVLRAMSRYSAGTTYSVMPQRNHRAEEHRGADGLAALGAGAMRQHQRHRTEGRAQAGHEHRAQARRRGLDDGVDELRRRGRAAGWRTRR